MCTCLRDEHTKQTNYYVQSKQITIEHMYAICITFQCLKLFKAGILFLKSHIIFFIEMVKNYIYIYQI
jgi:hypothetical protein